MDYIQLARALINNKKRYNVVAFILDRKNNIISIGENKNKTHPMQSKYALICKEDKKIFLHAEIDAIIKLRVPERAYKIIVIRFKKSGRTGLARPCKICMRAIRDLKIKLIEYTL